MRSGAPRSVWNWPSIAASLTGWCSATCRALTSPLIGCNSADTAAIPNAIPSARRWKRLSGSASRRQAWMAATAKPTDR
jgi:hypothetical protein